MEAGFLGHTVSGIAQARSHDISTVCPRKLAHYGSHVWLLIAVFYVQSPEIIHFFAHSNRSCKGGVSGVLDSRKEKFAININCGSLLPGAYGSVHAPFPNTDVPFASVLNLETFERQIKAEGLGMGAELAIGDHQNLNDADFICSLFRFIQLTCEGHNLGTVAPGAISVWTSGGRKSENSTIFHQKPVFPHLRAQSEDSTIFSSKTGFSASKGSK